MINSLNLAKQCSKIAGDKKALDIVILELKGLTDLSDYFVICSGMSSKQIKAIADSVDEVLTKKGIKSLHYEIDTDCKWVILDYVNVIVHVFDEETRHFYKLEQLWGDAKRI